MAATYTPKLGTILIPGTPEYDAAVAKIQAAANITTNNEKSI